MAEEPQQQRTQAVGLDDRPSTADRVRQIQEMQMQAAMEEVHSAPTQAPAAPPPTSTPATVKHAATAFDVAPVQTVSTDIHGERVRGSDQATYAKAQVDPAKLFGGGDKIELTGTPWKVIDFTPFLPALFKPAKPMEQYEARVPDQAAKTDQGVLFNVELHPKEGQEPVQQRAVLTTASGQLAGAECRNPGELSQLLSHAPALASQIMASAFGDAQPGAQPQIVNLTRGRRSAFEAVVARGGETRSVQVNNFGRPVPPGVDGMRANLIVANYLNDRFEAVQR